MTGNRSRVRKGDMTIEKEFFANYRIEEDKLTAYGFRSENGALRYTKVLPEQKLEICLTYDGELTGKVMDPAFGEEYTNYRLTGATGFSAEVRQHYTDLLLDIRKHCCSDLHFRSEQARRIDAFLHAEYGGVPEFLWTTFPSYGVYRQEKTGKWYAFIGRIARRRLDPSAEAETEVEVLNVKVAGHSLEDLLKRDGYYRAYHMNKKTWVSVSLDDTVEDEEIREMIRGSYDSL